MITTAITTRRLLIRHLQVADFDAVYAYTSLPAVMLYMEEGVQTAEQTRVFLVRNSNPAEATAYALCLQADNRLIGHLVFHPWYAPRTYEIGWVLHPAFHRQGYASEAALALLHYGFTELRLHRMIATCQPQNLASVGVMEKIGMRREGHFRQCIHRGGDVWWDEYFYALLAEEWTASSLY